MRRVRVLVSGRVQGVNFRWSTAERARAAGLAGWVRNLPDGRVEAVFEGPSEVIDGLVAWCGRGPTGARVSGVEATDQTPEGLTGFDVEF